MVEKCQFALGDSVDLNASVMRLLKRNSSPADLMHSPISKSDHSAMVWHP